MARTRKVPWTTTDYDAECLKEFPWILGMDEVGRGCVAGPILVGGVLVTPKTLPQLVNHVCDSKLLKETERDEQYSYLMRHFPTYGASISAADVDSLGINPANDLAFSNLARQVRKAYGDSGLILADGNLWLASQDSGPHRNLIKGESLSSAIAAGSIIAKVTRDFLMTQLASQHPAYQLDKHKGYGTKTHMEAITSHGLVPGLHRRSFLKKLC